VHIGYHTVSALPATEERTYMSMNGKEASLFI
jgi:hypothetical protein